MKKLILITFLSVFFGITSYAQETTVGAKAGVNLSNISGDETDDLQNKLGFHFGGFVEFKLSDIFSVQPELVFSSQGYKFEETLVGIDYSDKTTLNYINIPVMLKLYPVDGLNINAGPQLGLLLSAKNVYAIDDNELETDVKEAFSGTDFGFAFGFEFNADPVRIYGRYNLGLANISGDDITDVSVQNTVIQFGVGVGFL